MFKAMIERFRRRHVTTLKAIDTSMTGSLSISLGDVQREVANAMAVAFASAPHVEVVCGDLLGLSCDAIVSPANSFGNMGRGFDRAIDNFHRGAAQTAVRNAIAEHFFGELPVGSALVVELNAACWPFIVAAPTMRVPGDIQGTINAYLAMRAALVAGLRHNRDSIRPIKSLAIPGLGTGVGGLGFEDAAAQMRAAYDSVIGGAWKTVSIGAQAPFALRGK